MGVRHPVGERKLFGSGASNWLKLALFSHLERIFWFSSFILAFSINLFSFLSIFLRFFLDFGKVSEGFSMIFDTVCKRVVRVCKRVVREMFFKLDIESNV